MRHSITLGDITDIAVDKNIRSNYPDGIDFCYTDPPWGNGNLKYWKTINRKMNNRECNLLDQETLENRVTELIASYVNNYAFVVYGVREAKSLMDKLKAKPSVKDVQYYEKIYDGNKKNCIICITLNQAEVLDFSFVANTKGVESLVKICELFKDRFNSVLEMFVGIGYYLKILDKYGFKVIGNELNEARLSKALGKIK